jgi:hypothetical protein
MDMGKNKEETKTKNYKSAVFFFTSGVHQFQATGRSGD